jgi:hypothetical protein
MPGIITRSTQPDLLWPGIQAIFGTSYEKLEKQYTRIFDVRRSKKAYEKVLEATGFGMAAVKGEGQSISYDSTGQGPVTVFTHVTYGLGYIVTREAQEDNQYQEVAEANAQALPFSMLVTKETVHANVLNRGFNGSYVGGDGQPLFSVRPVRAAVHAPSSARSSNTRCSPGHAEPGPRSTRRAGGQQCARRDPPEAHEDDGRRRTGHDGLARSEADVRRLYERWRVRSERLPPGAHGLARATPEQLPGGAGIRKLKWAAGPRGEAFQM